MEVSTWYLVVDRHCNKLNMLKLRVVPTETHEEEDNDGYHVAEEIKNAFETKSATSGKKTQQYVFLKLKSPFLLTSRHSRYSADIGIVRLTNCLSRDCRSCHRFNYGISSR